MHGLQVKVISRKSDLSVQRTWSGKLLEQNENLIVILGEFENAIDHAGLGSIARGTQSREYFWLDRGYNVFRFQDPTGDFRNYYCNVTMPPKFEGGVLDYVDLDLVVLVWPDGRVEVLDEADFDANSVKFGYYEAVIRVANASLKELLRMIEHREFPFEDH